MYTVLYIQDWLSYADEPMGSKDKFWVRDPHANSYLFKYGRPNTGEVWAEKVAAEIAELMTLPHAKIELAEHNNRIGTLSKNFVRKPDSETLYHGNQLLHIDMPEYDKEKAFGQSQHTYNNIVSIINRLNARAPLGVTGSLDTMSGTFFLAGYFVLDSLIANTDRHHENWAVIVKKLAGESELHIALAPTYDHASSLGRELLDGKIANLLSQRGSVQTYVERGHTPIYWGVVDRKGLSPLELVRRAAMAAPWLYKYWLEIALDVRMDDIKAIFHSLPKGLGSEISYEFAIQMMCYAKSQFKHILEELPG